MKASPLVATTTARPLGGVFTAAGALLLASFGCEGRHPPVGAAPPPAAVRSQSGAKAVAPFPPGAPRYIGVLVPRETADIAPRIDGQLAEVHVRRGQRVGKGELLATIDAGPIRQELSMAEARLRSAVAEHARARLEHEQAQERARRLEKAAAHLSLEELSKAQYDEKLAAAVVAALEAKTAEERAHAAQLKESLSLAQVSAPFEGLISELFLDRGAWVDRSTPLLRLISDGELRARFAVPEANAGLVSPGMKVVAALRSSELELRGEVDQVAPEVDVATRFRFCEAQLELTPEHRASMPVGLVVEVRPAAAD